MAELRVVVRPQLEPSELFAEPRQRGVVLPCAKG